MEYQARKASIDRRANVTPMPAHEPDARTSQQPPCTIAAQVSASDASKQRNLARLLSKKSKSRGTEESRRQRAQSVSTADEMRERSDSSSAAEKLQGVLGVLRARRSLSDSKKRSGTPGLLSRHRSRGIFGLDGTVGEGEEELQLEAQEESGEPVEPVVFIRADAFRAMPIPWPRCQDLVDSHALPQPDDLMIALSHGWPYQAHPDPIGVKTPAVLQLIERAQAMHAPRGQTVLFIDFLSVSQRPFSEGQPPRTAAEEECFGLALQS